MRRTAASLATGALIATLAWASSPATALDPAPGTADLAKDINLLLADSRLDGGRAAVVVRSVVTGEELYAQDAGKIMTPASNAKLFTSAAAAEVLGLDHRFETTVLRAGRQSRGTVKGDLVLRGTGDPTMLADDYAALAAQVAATGVRVVTGALVADDTYFDGQRLGNDWTWDDEPYAYSAPVSALTASPDLDYDAGSVIVSVAPAASGTNAPNTTASGTTGSSTTGSSTAGSSTAGSSTAGSSTAGSSTAGSRGTDVQDGVRPKAVQVSTTPKTDVLTFDNRATVGETTDVTIERQHGTDTVRITGTVAEKYSAWVSVADPTRYAADLFRSALAEHGVRVLGRTVVHGSPANAVRIAEHRSMPLRELLIPFVKLSNNAHAEILTKAMGRKVSGAGTWAAGLKAVSDFAAARGVKTLSLRDGSGLSRRDGVTAAGISQLLLSARGRPWFPAWYAALPVAGHPDRLVGGTLRSRMRGTPAAGNVHAKTGSLSGVTSLSGYVTSADGEPLVFSVLLNQYPAGAPKDIEDGIAVRLARFSRTAPDSGAPALRETRVRHPDFECSWLKPAGC